MKTNMTLLLTSLFLFVACSTTVSTAEIAADDLQQNLPESCNPSESGDLSSPSIEILNVDKTGGFYSEDFRITGKIRGKCLQEASLFQDGQKVLDIPVHPLRNGSEQEFHITVDASRSPEIRAFSQVGGAKVLPIDVLDYRG